MRVENGTIVVKSKDAAKFSKVPSFLKERNPNLEAEEIVVEPFSGSLSITESWILIAGFFSRFCFLHIAPTSDMVSKGKDSLVFREGNTVINCYLQKKTLLVSVSTFNGDFSKPAFKRSFFVFSPVTAMVFLKQLLSELKAKHALTYTIKHDFGTTVFTFMNERLRIINTTHPATTELNSHDKKTLAALLEMYLLSLGTMSVRERKLSIENGVLKASYVKVPLKLDEAFVLKELL